MLLPAGPPPDPSEHPKLSVGPTVDAGSDPVGEGGRGLLAAMTRWRFPAGVAPYLDLEGAGA